MKKIFYSLVLLTVIQSQIIASTDHMAILREWAAYAGETDSTFKTPTFTHEAYTYVAAVVLDDSTGADINITKYNVTTPEWSLKWNGPGNGRDQASDIYVDGNGFTYVSGATYVSAANNFDWFLLRIAPDGQLSWARTWNGTASNYDVATAVVTPNDSEVIVTGVANNLGTMLDYHTIKYNSAGTILWQKDFDFNSLMDIPFDIAWSDEDTSVLITGGSQYSITDWDYQTIKYAGNGDYIDDSRVSGTSVGFDRAQAIKVDDSSNVYITGGAYYGSDFDIETVKLNKDGNLIWNYKYSNGGGGDDLGMDLIVDNDEKVYVCGTTYGNHQDYLLFQLDKDGSKNWEASVDGSGNSDDTARAMCFDSYGNVIITGQAHNGSNYDFLTVAFDPEGNELWRDYFDGPGHGDDNATNISADTFGNIYVSGQVWVCDVYQTVTIKYRTEYFTEPPAVDSPSMAILFYPNEGQLIDANDSLITDSVHYYTVEHKPQLYFGYGSLNMVWSHIDKDTSTSDSLQRVDVSFLNSSNPTEAYPINERQDAGYLNYFLPQCPLGIRKVYGNEGVLFTDVWPDIDILFSSSEFGLKLFLIRNPNAVGDITEAGFHFEGQYNLTVSSNWELLLNTILGDYYFAKPRVYQLDTNNNRIPLSWHLNWNIPQSGDANFNGWGAYDASKALVIEISNPVTTAWVPPGNLDYSSYTGSTGSDISTAIQKDFNENIVMTGYTRSVTFPLTPGFANLSSTGLTNDAFVFNSNFDGARNWGTLYGGRNGGDYGGTFGLDLDVDSKNNVYVVGYTTDNDLIQADTAVNNSTLTSPFKGDSLNGRGDHFIIKLDTAGNIKWANYIGGTNNATNNELEEGDIVAVSVDKVKDKIFMVGGTKSTSNFPIYYNRTAYNQSQNNRTNDNANGYILELDTNGIPVWGSYFGGDNAEIFDVQVVQNQNSDFHLYVAGSTSSKDYDTASSCNTPPSVGGGFPDCNSLAGDHDTYSTLQQRAFIGEFDSNMGLVWTELVGDDCAGCIDEMGPHCLAGYDSTIYFAISRMYDDTLMPFPTISSGEFQQACWWDITNTYADGFVARFNNRHMKWATFIGADDDDQINAISCDDDHNLYITGTTYIFTPTSVFCAIPPFGEFPLCDNPHTFYFQSATGGYYDSYITIINSLNQLSWSTLVGGNLDDLAMDILQGSNITSDYIFSVGQTYSSATASDPLGDYPIVFKTGAYNNNLNSGNGDGYLSRFEVSPLIEVKEKNVTENLMLYPNPCTNRMILYSKDIIDKKFVYSIVDILGQIVQSGNLPATRDGKFIFDMSRHAPGAYFIRLVSEKESLLARIIKE